MDVSSALAGSRLVVCLAVAALFLTGGWAAAPARAESDSGQVVNWGQYGPFAQPIPAPLTDPGPLHGKTVTALGIGQSMCALADGHVYCWGGGMSAFFPGSGSPTPVLVDSGSLAGQTVGQLALGSGMACAVAQGKAHCWGHGPLGNGDWSSPSPVPVTQSGPLAGKTVQTVSVAEQTACLVAEGQVYCWGYSGVGFGVPIPQPTDPAGVLSGKTVSAVSVGPSGSACVIADGRAYCTGQGTVFAPVTSDALADATVTAIAVGQTHSCLVARGQAYCWGDNSRGQLGTGIPQGDQLAPVYTGGALAGRTVQSIAVGKEHTCALAEGMIACWGDNSMGQLGTDQPLTGGTYSPVPVATASGYLVAAGMTETCSVTTQTVYCWGWGVTRLNRIGEAFRLNVRASRVVGDCAVIEGRVHCWSQSSGPMSYVAPIPVGGLPSGPVTDLSTAAYHGCAVVEGKAYCWGANSYGQLGNGTLKTSPKAVRVISKSAWGRDRVTSISTGQSHTCAIAAGRAYCWGSGSLGTTLIKRSTKPRAVPIPGKVTWISAGPGEWVYEKPSDEDTTFTGRTDTCAVSDARLYCWGWNTHGQLGTGDTRSSGTPTLVTSKGLRGKKARSVTLNPGNAFWPRACAIASGRAFCWGPGYGRVPARIKGLPNTTVKQLTVGPSRDCALLRSGVRCWRATSPQSTQEKVNTTGLGRGRIVQMSPTTESGIWQP